MVSVFSRPCVFSRPVRTHLSYTYLYKPPLVGHEVLGVLVVDGGQLSPGRRLREEGIYKEPAEDVQSSAKMAGIDVEEVVRVLRCVMYQVYSSI